MKSMKVMQRNFRQWLQKNGAIDSRGMVKGNYTSKWLWQMMSQNDNYELRQEWLALAGWDPAGWTLMNWHQLAPELKVDLARIPLDQVAALGNHAHSEKQ